MIRTLFVIVIIIHGLIHSIGFISEWKITPVKGFTGATIFPMPPVWLKIFGLLWLLALVALLTAGVALIAHKDWWWITALAGVILSQLLIIVYWQDAKWGTVFNIFILLTGIVWFHLLNETLAEE